MFRCHKTETERTVAHIIILPEFTKDMTTSLHPELQQKPSRDASKASTGLVSRQVELWEAPRPGHPKPYRHRPQDSFQVKETRTDEDDGDAEESDEREDDSSSRYTAFHPRAAPKMDSSRVIQSSIESGCQQYELGHYERAESDFQEALQTTPQLAWGNLGATHLQLGNYRKAKGYLQKCLLWKNEHGTEAMADILLNMGNAMCENLDESVFWYQLALEDLERHQGSDEDKANALYNLGRVYAQHKQWGEAREHLEQAYGLTKQVHGEHHISMAQTFDLLGYVNMALGNYDQAMFAYTSAMAIYRRLKGPIHASVAQSLLNMGLLRECKGELSEAWEAYTTSQELLTRLNTDQDDPLMQLTSQSIHLVELLIAKQKQDRLQRAHKGTQTG